MAPLQVNLEYQVRRAAGILGIIESFSWIVLSIICMGFFLSGKKASLGESYMENVQYLMYTTFLERGTILFDNQSLKPEVFFVFMWVYLFLDVAWFYASVKIVKKSEGGKEVARDTRIWSYSAFFICLVDFIIAVILGADYHHCVGIETEIYTTEEACANAIFPVLIIAVKGFTLWIINLIFGLVMLNISQRLKLDSFIIEESN